MWRKKKDFNEFLGIVKDMPFLRGGRTYRGYRRWNHVTRSYDVAPVEPINIESLMSYVNTLEDSYQTSGSHSSLEEYKIECLNNWVRLRNYNATKEFRETRKTTEYFNRLEKYEKR